MSDCGFGVFEVGGADLMSPTRAFLITGKENQS
jgi:hypothetical protein